MSKTHKKSTPAGGAISDDKGNRSWVWKGEELDTARVRALGEELSLDGAPPPGLGPPALDPYNRVTAPGEAPPKRRTLDDMRKLSEQIKKAKQWKRES
jgi:hypothetical protein